ncbi:hypothetical protein [Hymenobacter armeniacus]|uniref:Outer membrane beta-barrel porin/alpha-amylase n=1 Tax=Hymenobacter armeniacus TaxID=2771358 RepID=A0ABR8JM41_9BACT|nr:hypothetical protein [Hymenobacter armeniacus]MBD2721065.1 hypothetical protein [Hymenobacter armeniacus]
MTFSATCSVLLLAGALLAGTPRAAAAPAPADTAATDAPTRNFSAALGYGSNSTYFGRSQAVAFPYLTADFTYTAKNGLFGTLGLYNLLNTPAALDETDLTVGWDHDFGRTLDVSVSYSRFFFPTNSQLVKSNVNNAFDAALGQDWGVVYSRLSATYLFGKSTSKGDAFLTLENSRSFEIPHVFGADNYLTIEPLVSVAAGTQSFAEAALDKRNGTTKVRNVRRFSVVDYELSVPVRYTVGKLELAAGWRYVVPVNLPADDVDSRALSVWTAGLTFTL